MKLCWIRSFTAVLALTLFMSVGTAAQTNEKQTSGTDNKTELAAPAIGPASPQLTFNLDLHPSKLNNVVFDEPSLSRISGPHNFEATAYSLRGLTAKGTLTRQGIVAADPNVLPLGSVVAIETGNYSGIYEVHDTGAKVKGNLVDIWMPTNQECRQFGRRSVKLTVLKYGPARRVKSTQKSQ